jgi:large subunit ribosomal protein L10
LRIVKNSLSERAADRAGTESLKPLLEGPTALALVHGDAALAAKALNDTARALNILEFKGGLMNGDTLSADDIRSIARLPARDVLNAQLVGTIAAPLTGLARGLNALIAGVAIQLQAMADQGLVSGEPARAESGGDAPAADESDAPAADESDAPAADEAEAPAADGAEEPTPDEADAPTPDESEVPVSDASPGPVSDASPAPVSDESEPPASNESEPSAADAPDSGASSGEPDAQEAAEQDVQDPDSEPHDAPVQPSQAEGEDVATQEDE